VRFDNPGEHFVFFSLPLIPFFFPGSSSLHPSLMPRSSSSEILSFDPLTALPFLSEPGSDRQRSPSLCFQLRSPMKEEISYAPACPISPPASFGACPTMKEPDTCPLPFLLPVLYFHSPLFPFDKAMLDTVSPPLPLFPCGGNFFTKW